MGRSRKYYFALVTRKNILKFTLSLWVVTSSTFYLEENTHSMKEGVVLKKSMMMSKSTKTIIGMEESFESLIQRIT